MCRHTAACPGATQTGAIPKSDMRVKGPFPRKSLATRRLCCQPLSAAKPITADKLAWTFSSLSSQLHKGLAFPPCLPSSPSILTFCPLLSSLLSLLIFPPHFPSSISLIFPHFPSLPSRLTFPPHLPSLLSLIFPRFPSSLSLPAFPHFPSLSPFPDTILRERKITRMLSVL